MKGNRLNSVWYLADKGGRAVLNLVLFAAVSRSLGPEALGDLGYGLALLALASGWGVPALETWLIAQWPVVAKDRATHWMALAGRTHVLFTGVALLVALWWQPTGVSVALLAAAGMFRGSDVFKTYLEAHGEAKRTVLFDGAAFAVGAGAKLACVWLDAEFGWFAAAFALETVLAWPLLAWAVGAAVPGAARALWTERVSTQDWTRFVRQTFPQTLAYVLFLGQLRLGTLLLEAWSTPEALGQWTAATRLLEVWSFVPWALTAPWYPAAVRAGWGSVERARLVRKMALWSLGSAAVLALPISLGASVWVDWIYGDAFAPTAPLLTVAAFNLFPWFSYLFWVRWMHLQHRSHAVPVFSALYVVVQAVLAALWIPADGALGAAWAALVSGISVMSLAYAYGMFTNAPSPENSAKEINT